MIVFLRKLISVTRYPEFIRLIWWRTIVPWRIRNLGVQIHKSTRFYGSPIVSMEPDGRINIGSRCVLCSDSRYTALGVNHPVILRTLKASAHIQIGEDSGISGASICAALSVVIGREVLLGANVVITDTDFHAVYPTGRRFNENLEDIKSSPVFIEDNVFVGTGAIILKGVTIGRNSVIAAGAVVTRNIPENVIAAGNPARVVSPIGSPSISGSLLPDAKEK